MSMNKVSVLLSYYNDQRYLSQAIDSILAQSYENFELILLNHASTDGSRKIAHSYQDPRIVHAEMDRNIYYVGSEVFLKFLNIAQGEYVKFFCADDIMEKHCLRQCVQFLDLHPDYGAVCAKMNKVDSKGKSLGDSQYLKKLVELASGKSTNDYLKMIFEGVSPFAYPTVCIRRSLIHESYVHRTFIALFDVYLWANLLFSGCQFKFLDEVLVQYRVHEGQVGNWNNAPAIRRENFEWFHILDLFFQKLNHSQAKGIFGAEISEDPELLKFNLCQIALNSCARPGIRQSALHHLIDLMQDDRLRAKIRQDYGFDIPDLRRLLGSESDQEILSVRMCIQFLIRRFIRWTGF